MISITERPCCTSRVSGNDTIISSGVGASIFEILLGDVEIGTTRRGWWPSASVSPLQLITASCFTEESAPKMQHKALGGTIDLPTQGDTNIYSLGERSEPVLVNSMAILFVGRAQRARTSELNGNFVCMNVYMSSTDRGQCACVPAQRANVAGLASSARCARPQMLCILLV